MPNSVNTNVGAMIALATNVLRGAKPPDVVRNTVPVQPRPAQPGARPPAMPNPRPPDT